VRALLRRGVHCTPAHGVGRYFDALGALLLSRPLARYEGEVAMALESAADPRERGAYPFALCDAADPPWQVDLRPAVRAVVRDVARGVPAGVVAARFHETLARVAETLVERAIQQTGDLPVVLTGGCFQNALLADRVSRRLAARTALLRHREVPPGDGGIALGQAAVAAACLAGGGEQPTCV
jgi:hydrogenase maturation protein HypF